MTIVKVVNKPNKFLSIKMEDEAYTVTIRYLDTTYPEDLASGNLQSDAIMVRVKPKPGYPNIRFILKTNVTNQNIGIDMTEVGFVSAGSIETCLERLHKADECIASIKEVMEVYFPGILQ